MSVGLCEVFQFSPIYLTGHPYLTHLWYIHTHTICHRRLIDAGPTSGTHTYLQNGVLNTMSTLGDSCVHDLSPLLEENMIAACITSLFDQWTHWITITQANNEHLQQFKNTVHENFFHLNSYTALRSSFFIYLWGLFQCCSIIPVWKRALFLSTFEKTVAGYLVWNWFRNIIILNHIEKYLV